MSMTYKLGVEKFKRIMKFFGMSDQFPMAQDGNGNIVWGHCNISKPPVGIGILVEASGSNIAQVTFRKPIEEEIKWWYDPKWFNKHEKVMDEYVKKVRPQLSKLPFSVGEDTVHDLAMAVWILKKSGGNLEREFDSVIKNICKTGNSVKSTLIGKLLKSLLK